MHDDLEKGGLQVESPQLRD